MFFSFLFLFRFFLLFFFFVLFLFLFFYLVFATVFAAFVVAAVFASLLLLLLLLLLLFFLFLCVVCVCIFCIFVCVFVFFMFFVFFGCSVIFVSPGPRFAGTPPLLDPPSAKPALRWTPLPVSAGPPKISRFFPLSAANFRSFISLMVSSWNCGHGSRPWPTQSARLGFSGGHVVQGWGRTLVTAQNQKKWGPRGGGAEVWGRKPRKCGMPEGRPKGWEPEGWENKGRWARGVGVGPRGVGPEVVGLEGWGLKGGGRRVRARREGAQTQKKWEARRGSHPSLVFSFFLVF